MKDFMQENLAGRSTAVVQGWCPTGWRPMQAQDGWIVRIRPHCASVSAEQWLVLAELALSHAHPEIELTRLGNVQLRGVSEAHLSTVHSALLQAHLLPADADVDQAPAVHCTPFYRLGDPTHALAVLLTQTVQTQLSPKALHGRGLEAMPSKFGLVVDDSRRRMSGMGADLCLWVGDDGRYGLGLGDCGHGYGFDKVDDAVAAAVNAALWFAQKRRAFTPAPTRLKKLQIPDALDLPCLNQAERFSDGPGLAEAERTGPIPPGLLQDGSRVMGAPLGRIDAAAMHRVMRHMPSQAEIRVTPWRSLVFDAKSLACQIAAAEPAYWIAQADDARLRVSACTGAPRCTQALVSVQELALWLAPQVPEKAHLHLSACAKCCALPPEATAVLLAVAGADHQITESADPATSQVVFHVCSPDRIANPVAQISPQALSNKPSQISKLIYDLHI
ncbi:MAG: nitrite reductase [Comamonas sp.]